MRTDLRPVQSRAMVAFRVLVVAVAASLSAVALAEARPVESYVLGNGLTVVVAPDHKVPKVAVTLRYRVGVANEPVGRSGFAHLFEHLMFSGTPTYPNIDATLSALGLSYNATTEEDKTTYIASGMASALPVILSVEADRMANIGASVTRSDLDTQRSVVLNEMRQTVLDSPGSAAFTALQSGMFPQDHPYRRAVIGSIADIEAATLEDVRAFFDAYYVPANAVLVIVGDVEIEAVKSLVEQTFGRIAPSQALPVPVVSDAAPMRVRIEDTDAVAGPTVLLGFSGPATDDAEDAALLIASDLLSNEGGPLRDLVNEGVATFAAGSWMPGDLGGRFMFFAGGGAGVTPEILEQRLRMAIAKFAASPIDLADLERSRSAFLIGFRTSLEAYAPRSSYIASVVSETGSVDHVLEVPPELLNVTAVDVERQMRRILVDADVSVAVVRPGARGDYPDVLREPSGVAQPLKAAERAPVAIPVLDAGDPAASELPARETANLINGIRVVHYRMAGAPMAYLSVVVSGGTNNDPRGREGIYQLSTEMGSHGAGDRNEEELAEALRDANGGIGMWSGASSSGATLSIVPDKLAAGVDLLADVVQKPRFDPESWAVLKAQTMQLLAQRESDLGTAASRALDRTVYFPGPDDAGIDFSAETIGSITLEELRAVYRGLFVPASMTIYSVGDLPIDTVVEALEPRFGAWHDETPAIIPKSSLQPVFPDRQRVFFVSVPGASQATIQISRRAPGYDEAEYPEAIAVNNLLAGDFSSRLNTVIREQKGYSYGVEGRLWGWLRHDGGLTVSIPVQADATGAALADAVAGFESLAVTTVTDAELERSVTTYLTAQASFTETAGGLFGALVSWEQDGVELDSLVRLLRQLTELKLDDVRAVASSIADLEQAVIVVAGDPDIVLPQLVAMGFSEVETVDLDVPID